MHKPLSYRPDIDGLRAIAVLAVVIHHAFPKLFKSGYIGVDIFFVISGYLISSILFKDLEHQRFSLLEFYSRRIQRIFPALILVISSIYVLGWFSLFDSEFALLGQHIAAGSVFISNLLLLGEAGYFDQASTTKPLLHLWSLGVEEQFYIFWPLLLGFTHSRHGSFLRITSSILVLSMAYNLYTVTQAQEDTAFYSPLTRFWELMTGGLIAYLQHHSKNYRAGIARGASWIAILGLTCLVLGFLILKGHHHWPGYRALLPVSGAALLIASGPDTALHRCLLSNRLAVGIGLISYPLYLWHWPLLAFCHILEGETPAWPICMAAIVLSILLATLTYEWLEKPLKTLRLSCLPKQWLLATLMSLLGILGLTTYLNHGFPERKANFDASQLQHWNRNPYQSPAQFGIEPCDSLLNDSAVKFAPYECWSNSPAPQTLFLGDSHAGALYLGALSDESRLSAMVYRQPGCLPFSDYVTSPRNIAAHKTACLEMAEQTPKILLHLPSIDTVILVTRGPFYFTGEEFGHDGWPHSGNPLHQKQDLRLLLGPEAEEAFLDGYNTLIKQLLALKRKVIFVTEWPELDFDPGRCVKRALELPGHQAKACSLLRSRVESRQQAYRRLIERLYQQNPEIYVFDSLPYFCDDTVCSPLQAGEIRYQDDDHLNMQGSTQLLGNLISRHYR